MRCDKETDIYCNKYVLEPQLDFPFLPDLVVRANLAREDCPGASHASISQNDAALKPLTSSAYINYHPHP